MKEQLCLPTGYTSVRPSAQEGSTESQPTSAAVQEDATRWTPAPRRRPYKAVVRELEELKAATTGSLINREAVRQLALDMSQTLRRGKFTRVSDEFLNDIEAAVRTMVVSRVQRSGGSKTL
jgi:hypothetical protein